MDKFSKLVKFYPIVNQKVETIIRTMETKYLREIGTPETILSDKGSQFIGEKWSNFGKAKGFMVRHTSPYNPQSNPVERVMKELGRIMRTYAHHKHTTWNLIIPRAEKVINATEYRSTGMKPIDLHEGRMGDLNINKCLKPITDKIKNIPGNVASATRKMKERASERRKQAENMERSMHIKRGRRYGSDFIDNLTNLTRR